MIMRSLVHINIFYDNDYQKKYICTGDLDADVNAFLNSVSCLNFAQLLLVSERSKVTCSCGTWGMAWAFDRELLME